MAPQEPTKGELIKNLDALEICRVNPLLLFFHSGLSKVKAKIATGQAEVLTRKVEAATDCAIHGNVKAEALTGKAEAATDCAIHGNVKAEALTGKAEAATDCAIHFILPLSQQWYKKQLALVRQTV